MPNPEPSPTARSLSYAEHIIRWAQQHRAHLAVVESITGGRIMAALTSIPGASAVFQGGLCAYCEQTKQEQLGISKALCEQEGVVSRACAEAMAKGIGELLHAEVTLSTTGFAGPEAPEGRLGEIWAAWVIQGKVQTATTQLMGNRMEIQAAAAEWALQSLWEALHAH